MKMLILDGNDHLSLEQIHDYVSEKLEFPEWYGNNLDALFDCLTCVSEPVTICVDHIPALLESLNGKGEILLKVLERVSEEQPLVTCLFSQN